MLSAGERKREGAFTGRQRFYDVRLASAVFRCYTA